MAIGELVVRIVGDSTALTQDLAAAARSTDSFSARARDSLNTFATGATVAMAGAVAGLAALYAEQSQVIDQTAKLADSIGITTEALTGLRYAAALTGVEQNTLDTALKKVNIKLAEAAAGSTDAAATFEKLGLRAADLLALPVEQRVSAIADGMAGLSSQTDRTAVAMKLFEEEGIALVNTLGGGSAALNAMTAEAEALGITLSRVDAAKVEQANDALTRVGAMADGLGKQLTVELAPVVEGVATEIKQWALEMGGFGEVSKIVINFLVGAAGRVGDVFRGWEIILKANKALLYELAAAAADAFASIAQSAAEPKGEVDGFFARIGQGMANVSAGAQRWAFGKSIGDVMGEASGQANEWASNMRQAANEAQDDLAETLNKPIPSVAADLWLADWRQKSETLAKETAAIKAEMAKPAPVMSTGSAVVDIEVNSSYEDVNQINQRLAERADTFQAWRDHELGKEREQTAYEMQILRERADFGLLAVEEYQRLKGGLVEEANAREIEAAAEFAFAIQTPYDLTELDEFLGGRADTLAEWRQLELDRIAEQNTAELELLRQRFESGLLSEEEYQALRQGIIDGANARSKAAEEANTKDRLNMASSMFSNLSSLMSSGSKKMFEIGKAASIANAVISGYEAVVSSYAAGAKIGGPWLGAAYAATAAAATFAQIQRIRSQSFGGGGGSPSAGMGGGAPSSAGQNVAQTGAQVQTPAAPSRTIAITLAGRSYSAADVRDLITEINEQIGDGATIFTA